VTAATTRLPQPLAATAVVTNDVPSRTPVVRLSEAAEGYARLLWRQGHQALVKAEHGIRPGAPTVWALDARRRQIGHGLPAHDSDYERPVPRPQDFPGRWGSVCLSNEP